MHSLGYNGEPDLQPRDVWHIIPCSKVMGYFKGILSGIAAIFLAECVPRFSQGIREQKATGLAAVAGGVVESFFSPLFWILAVLFFALFLGASRLANKLLRILLFWIPTLLFSTLGVAILALFTYAFLRLRPR